VSIGQSTHAPQRVGSQGKSLSPAAAKPEEAPARQAKRPKKSKKQRNLALLAEVVDDAYIRLIGHEKHGDRFANGVRRLAMAGVPVGRTDDVPLAVHFIRYLDPAGVGRRRLLERRYGSNRLRADDVPANRPEQTQPGKNHGEGAGAQHQDRKDGRPGPARWHERCVVQFKL
jgi:hypothetical protein